MRLLWTLLLSSILCSAHLQAAEAPVTDAFEQGVARLNSDDFEQKSAAVATLLEQHHARTRDVLAALLDGKLQARTADGRVFIAASEPDGEHYLLTDAVTGASVGTQPQADYQRIGTNNALRKALKGAIGRFDLTSADASVRLAAVQEMLRSPDEGTLVALREHVDKEQDEDVRKEIRNGLALADLDSSDADVRLAATGVLSESLNDDVYNRLKQLSGKDDAGRYQEADERVRSAAQIASQRIEFWRGLYNALSTLFFGLSLGSVLVLSAIGLAITFGVMGVINMAHGEMMMLGAYTAYVMQLLMPNSIGTALILAIPAAFVVSGLFGVAIERGIVRFLYGRPLETLLATFGLSLVLQQLVRTIFSPLNRSVSSPDWMSGLLKFNDAFSITYNRLYIIVFTMIVFAILLLVLKRTTLGLKVRAVSQNRAMAKAMGVRTEWVDALTFGLGSGIAGVAGVALSQLTNVGPNLGQAYIIDSFMVVVFGGVGNLWGTLIGGMSLGVVNKLLEPYAGAVLAKILVLVLLIMFIQRKPRGLFPQKGRAAEA
jgi:urea transport system permease protein